MKKALVIIPTYNERENIQKVIPILLEIFKKIKNWEMGILVVDDNSPDKTADAVKVFTKKHKNVHLLSNPRKAGLGGAYLKGMDKAFYEMNADVVFEFDADLSHDPQKIPIFIKRIDEGADMVLGSRYIPGGGIPADWGLHRKFLSVIGNMFITVVLTDFRIRDWTGGYRAITKPVYDAVRDELNTERFSGYTFQLGFLHKSVKKGFKIVEVPFKFVDRTIGESKLGIESLKNTLLYVLKVRMKDILENRIFKFVMVGGLGALIQFSLLYLFWEVLALHWNLATFLAIEGAVVSNFILNNLWTFADRKLKLEQVPVKFLQFNIASSGSIIIQYIVNFVGNLVIAASTILLTLPIINFNVKIGLFYTALGILIGMFWNFFAYSHFIWRKKK